MTPCCVGMTTRFDPSPGWVTRIGRSGSETPVSSGLFQPGHLTSGNATLILSGKGRVSISSAATDRGATASAIKATGNSSLTTNPGIVAIPLIRRRGAVEPFSQCGRASVLKRDGGDGAGPGVGHQQLSALGVEEDVCG